MTSDWFVVCRFTLYRGSGSDRVRVPASVAHAKRMGGTQTACGESAMTMAKLFDVPFPVVGENCSACMDAVAVAQRSRVRRA